MLIFVQMTKNIDIHVTCIHMLLYECVISLKRIMFWNGESTNVISMDEEEQASNTEVNDKQGQGTVKLSMYLVSEWRGSDRSQPIFLG
jgi:hypothetical protein